MEWKKRLFANIFWRNVLASFGERSGYSKKPGGFVLHILVQSDPVILEQSDPVEARDPLCDPKKVGILIESDPP